MTQSRTYAAGGLLVALLLALLGLSLSVAGPASAANRSVALTGSGPAPARISITVGDAITFTNADELGLSHVVTSSGDGWTYGPTMVASGASTTTAKFPQPGTYTYTDHRNTISTDRTGSIVVTGAPAAGPRPASAPATASPVSSPSRDPQPGAAPIGPSTVATPTESPSPSPVIAPAVAPVPMALAAVTAGPVQASAPASPDPAQAPVGPLAIAGSVNNSNHQQAYGLPAALAALAIAGIASLLIRLLLSHPAAR